MICLICNKDVNGTKGLAIHLTKIHNYTKEQIKEYYDINLKNENDGKCCFCENDAIFKGLTKGYHTICDSKICLGKTRATGTYEFLMYKYGLTKEEAIIEQLIRATDRGIKIKDKFDKLYEDDKDYHKKRSHNTKEFWINKGFNEQDSIEKSKEVMNMMHDKVWTKRRANPELYDNVNTTQLKYWIDKGYSEDESEKLRAKRQITNTVDNYIKKYGDKLGVTKFKERNTKWSEQIENKFKNGEFSKTSTNNYSKPELELFEVIIEKLDIIHCYSGVDNNQYFLRDNNKTYSYDFVFNNKVIEFNGDYWHCNPETYESTYYHNHKKMTANEIWIADNIKIEAIKNRGYDVLIIWENNYKQNKEKVIQECIEFLKS